MSTALTHSLIGGVPLLVLAVLAALIFRRKGPHPATYKMSEPWTHAPILWAATDENVGDGHGTATVRRSSTVGGGASGKW